MHFPTFRTTAPRAGGRGTLNLRLILFCALPKMAALKIAEIVKDGTLAEVMWELSCISSLHDGTAAFAFKLSGTFQVGSYRLLGLVMGFTIGS